MCKQVFLPRNSIDLCKVQNCNYQFQYKNYLIEVLFHGTNNFHFSLHVFSNTFIPLIFIFYFLKLLYLVIENEGLNGAPMSHENP